MAILIKGMEMPETCDECDFHIYHSDGEYVCVATPLLYPWNLANYKGGRKDFCPLVEVAEVQDAVSRQAAIDAARDWYEGLICGSFKGLEKRLRALPSVQPETAKRIVGKSRDGMTLWYQCDMCNEPVDAQDNFCRGCGRRLTDECN